MPADFHSGVEIQIELLSLLEVHNLVFSHLQEEFEKGRISDLERAICKLAATLFHNAQEGRLLKTPDGFSCAI